MPTFRGLEVRITDKRGVPLGERGIRHLKRTKTASCYIQSEHGMQFIIAMHPQLPFPNIADGEDVDTMDFGIRREPPRKWHLLASVYLDGRTKPERSAIVYLNEDHPNFRGVGGVRLAHRWVQDPDGSIAHHGWMFQDVDVETMLDRLILDGETEIGDDKREEKEGELGEAMESKDGRRLEQTSQAGQIVVVFTRVSVGSRRDMHNFRAMHRSDEKEDELDSRHLSKVDHTTARISEARTRYAPRKRVPVVDYRELEGDETPYATFRFYYRSKEQLLQLDLDDEVSTVKAEVKPEVTPEVKLEGGDQSWKQLDEKFTPSPPLGRLAEHTSDIASPSDTRKASETDRAISATEKKQEGKRRTHNHGHEISENEGRGPPARPLFDALEGNMTASSSETSAVDDSDASLGCYLPPSFRKLSKAPIRVAMSDQPTIPANATKLRRSDDIHPAFSTLRAETALTEDEADDEADSSAASTSHTIGPKRHNHTRTRESRSAVQTSSDEDSAGEAMTPLSEQAEKELFDGLAMVSLKRTHDEAEDEVVFDDEASPKMHLALHGQAIAPQAAAQAGRADSASHASWVVSDDRTFYLPAKRFRRGAISAPRRHSDATYDSSATLEKVGNVVVPHSDL